jgi:hypothetical protein
MNELNDNENEKEKSTSQLRDLLLTNVVIRKGVGSNPTLLIIVCDAMILQCEPVLSLTIDPLETKTS